MRCLVPLVAGSLAAACATSPGGLEPSLAPRPAEAIDPRVPIPADVPSGPVDSALVAQLAELVAQARAGTAEFDARQLAAARLVSAAGPMASETWVAAQQALSLLIEQFGVTTRVAANVDALGSTRLETQRWIRPADQQALAKAAEEVAAISGAQTEAIDRLKDQLAR